MKALSCLMMVFTLVILYVAEASAYTGGEMKSSPLFKASLEQSIAKLEGKVEVQTANVNGVGDMATKAGCVTPNVPLTQQPTCQPSYCGGGETCESTCYGNTCQTTCYNTCASTCANTCSQNTCANTCSGGYCSYNYIWSVFNYWHYNGSSSTNWRELYCADGAYKRDPGLTRIIFLGSNPPPSENGSWSLLDGHCYINKWYHNAITNIYDVRSDIYMAAIYPDFVDYYSILHSLSPPDNYGYGNIVDFYFYD